MNSDFVPVMAKLRGALSRIKGRIAVEGHTDDNPIFTAEYPSNWYLSSERALSVAHELLRDGSINDNRFMVIGYADTRPFDEGDSNEARSKNWRVQIVIRQEVDENISSELRGIDQIGEDLLDALRISESEIGSVN